MAVPLSRLAAFAMALALAASPARASTGGPPGDWGLNEDGGSAADRQMLYSGNPGVLLATSPAPFLFMAWRRLHGQAVSPEAGEALSVPCCGTTAYGATDAVTGWLDARKVVPGAASLGDVLDTERRGPDYTSIPNCLDDAFRNAARTLRDRAQAHGADSAEVRAWLGAQDAVFQACSKPVASLPALPDGAPDWLGADYRYQAAALAFYNGDYPAAAAAFAVIAGDAGSPWQGVAPYLRVRALLRQALASKVAADFAAAQEAAAAIRADAPMGGSAGRLGGMAQLHADPSAAAVRLVAALGADTLGVQAAADFKDLQGLSGAAAVPGMDWINTFKTGAAAPPVTPDDTGSALDRARTAEGRRGTALAHAREEYGAGHDPAWLLAVLALAQPDELAGTTVLADAAALDGASPAFLTAQYHRIRLTGAADPAAARAALDAVLARTDLTGTARNLFRAERFLVAADGGELARFALRDRICAADGDGCKSKDWGYLGQGSGLFDSTDDDAARRGMGDDARYVIDRMALGPRMALGRDAGLPAPIRLDLALTSFARAVLLGDEAAVDALCVQLGALLPVMGGDFAAISKVRRGPERLFAEYFVFAKIPGLRVDLLDYKRPVGAPADFQGSWPDWVVLAGPDPESIPPAPVLYDNAGYQSVDVAAGTDLGGGHVRVPDVVCHGLCGAGGFVPALPAFLSGSAVRAVADRRLLPPPGKYGDPAHPTTERRSAFPNGADAEARPVLAPPRGATDVWEFILDYAARHPGDPRVPEALHWLVHVGHYGGSHDHSGKRAYALLKSRYPASSWAKADSFYYD